MVFQRSNPFPKSVYENIAYALRLRGLRSRSKLDGIVEGSLRGAALWDEVKDRLHSSALGLSGGQHAAASHAPAPSPSGPGDHPDGRTGVGARSHRDGQDRGTDPRISPRRDFTIVIVTHNMQQAARISDQTAFFYMGTLIEYDRTGRIFTNPSQKARRRTT